MRIVVMGGMQESDLRNGSHGSVVEVRDGIFNFGLYSYSHNLYSVYTPTRGRDYKRLPLSSSCLCLL